MATKVIQIKKEGDSKHLSGCNRRRIHCQNSLSKNQLEDQTEEELLEILEY